MMSGAWLRVLVSCRTLRPAAPLVMLLPLLSCGSDGPTAPSAPAPTISCPADLAATAADGRSANVTYPAPTTTGGTQPVTVSCAPASGSNFNVGTTRVACTASDRDQRTASCAFNVAVSVPPYLRVTRFVAFGDSLTWGNDGTDAGGPTGWVPRARVENPYPQLLDQMLEARYTAQDFTVENRGISGETTTQGVARLDSVLRSYPGFEGLLLLEGANDIAGGDAATVRRARDNLVAMVDGARRSGFRVYLATLPPQRAGGSRAGGWALVPTLNAEIRSAAVSTGAVLVDLYAAFGSDIDALIDRDGLHPNQAGYQRIAETFFTTVRSDLEIPFPTGTSAAGALAAVVGASGTSAIPREIFGVVRRREGAPAEPRTGAPVRAGSPGERRDPGTAASAR